LLERVNEFAKLGIHHIDIWAWRSKGDQMDEVSAACRQYGSIINSTFDDASGSLTDANDLPRCLDAWAESLDRAQAWGVQHLFMFSEQINPSPPALLPVGEGRKPSPFGRRLGEGHVQGWVKPTSRDYTLQQKYANLLEGAARVMELVEKTNIVVWFEALNTYHLHGGVTVSTHELAADLVRRIAHPQLRMVFDCYHQQRTAGNLIQGLRDYYGLYDSVHIGDVPTRQEPGTGEINFNNIARTLRELGFDADSNGKVGLEFYPSTNERSAFEAVQAIFS
jgi:hydroxypyruvate isomerase